MPVGLQCWDANGTLTFDTTTMTSRVLGFGDYPVGTLVTITVPVSPGKRLWYRSQITGPVNCILYQVGAANQFTIQCDAAAYTNYNEPSGSAKVWWGEY